MSAFVQWCVFGLLAVVTLQDGHLVNASEDSKCKSVTVKSTERSIAKEEIKDSNGRRAVITSVKNIDTLGSTPCVRGENLFVFDNVVLAEDGCKAKLTVCYKSSDEPEPELSPGCKIIRLLSRYHREDTETLEETIDYIEVKEQYKESVECEKDRNFGARGKVAYANNGCRATFKVCFKRSPSEGEVECDFVLLKSTRTEKDEFKPTDEDGKPAKVVSVDLIRELPDSAKCTEWSTFRFTESVVTARRGCQGRFKVCYIKSGSDSGYPSKGCITVYLKSTLNDSDKKKVADDNRKIRSFELTSPDEGIRCVRNLNYGIRDGEIYASGGCKGSFKVCLLDSLPPSEKPKSTCVNVYLASWGPKEADWTKVTSKDGNEIIINDIKLVREDSRHACFKGRTFFLSRQDEVHAIDGCKGKFRVCYHSKRE